MSMYQSTALPDLSAYRTLIFDCDGVLLNSNRLKTEAFYHVALPYGETAARALCEYHISHGGISRYHKFNWFLSVVVGQSEPDPSELQALLDAYGNEVYAGMLRCESVDLLDHLREQNGHARWIVVSGSDEDELRTVFKKRELDNFFDGGIYGSPRNKFELMDVCAGQYQDFRPALFFGDARADYEAAEYAKIDFCHVSQWSESNELFSYGCPTIRKIDELVVT